MEQGHYENFRDKQLEKGGLSAGMTPEKSPSPSLPFPVMLSCGDSTPLLHAHRLKKDLNDKMQKQEELMRKKFTEQVKQEEGRFRTWEERLVSDGEKFNTDLDKMRAELNALKDEVNNLQSKANALSPKKK